LNTGGGVVERISRDSLVGGQMAGMMLLQSEIVFFLSNPKIANIGSDGLGSMLKAQLFDDLEFQEVKYFLIENLPAESAPNQNLTVKWVFSRIVSDLLDYRNIYSQVYSGVTLNFSIVNTEGEAMNIAFTVEGELAQYVTVTNDVISFEPGEKSKDLSYNLALPATLAPGLHKANIVATKLPDDAGGSDTVVGATVSVATQIYVNVPYPGKYLEAALNVISQEDTNIVDFYVPFINRGKQSLSNVTAVIDIYKSGEKVDTLVMNSMGAVSGERKELSYHWDPSHTAGKYTAKATVYYDGDTLNFEKDFNIGPEDFGVLGVSVNDFTLGDVAKVKILVQNKLSDDVNNAVANLKVYDSELQQIVDLKSESYVVPALANKEMVVYWDTEGLDKGQYGSELKVKYNQNFVNKNFKIDVSEDAMIFSGVGFVINSGGSGSIKSSTLMWIVIGILVLANLAWFAWWMGHKKKRL